MTTDALPWLDIAVYVSSAQAGRWEYGSLLELFDVGVQLDALMLASSIFEILRATGEKRYCGVDAHIHAMYK